MYCLCFLFMHTKRILEHLPRFKDHFSRDYISGWFREYSRMNLTYVRNKENNFALDRIVFSNASSTWKRYIIRYDNLRTAVPVSRLHETRMMPPPVNVDGGVCAEVNKTTSIEPKNKYEKEMQVSRLHETRMMPSPVNVDGGVFAEVNKTISIEPKNKYEKEMQTCTRCNKESSVYGEYCRVSICKKCCEIDIKALGRHEINAKKFLENDEFIKYIIENWCDKSFQTLIHNKCDPRSHAKICRRRADFRLVINMENIPEFDIVVEIDERQHTDRGHEDERKRMHELVTASGDRPIMFFRLNPDSYKNQNGNNTLCLTQEEYIAEFHKRMTFLVERVKKLLESTKRRFRANRNYKLPIVRIEYLFFDTKTKNSKYDFLTIRSFWNKEEVLNFKVGV